MDGKLDILDFNEPGYLAKRRLDDLTLLYRVGMTKLGTLYWDIENLTALKRCWVKNVSEIHINFNFFRQLTVLKGRHKRQQQGVTQ